MIHDYGLHKFTEIVNERTRQWNTIELIFHWYKKVQVGKDQEKAQSEKDSHSKNRGGINSQHLETSYDVISKYSIVRISIQLYFTFETVTYQFMVFFKFITHSCFVVKKNSVKLNSLKLCSIDE